MGILSRSEIDALGFKSAGNNLLISDKASFYGANRISLGNNVRIDDFCVLSAGVEGIKVGNYVHIAVYSSLIGAGAIYLNDYCNLSSRVAIYSSNDDYSGEYMTNPMVSDLFTNVTSAPVSLGKHTIIGSGSVILPGLTLGIGVAIGALSLVNKNCVDFGIYAGAPARLIKMRSKNLLELEAKFRIMQHEL